jgi:protein tyrosine/serine phosphatase
MAAEKRGIQPAQVDMTNMEAFVIQHGTYIDASRNEMIDEYGSVDSYISTELGISGDELHQLRIELLE